MIRRFLHLGCKNVLNTKMAVPTALVVPITTGVSVLAGTLNLHQRRFVSQQSPPAAGGFEERLERSILDVLIKVSGVKVPIANLTRQLPDDLLDDLPISLREFLEKRDDMFELKKMKSGIFVVGIKQGSGGSAASKLNTSTYIPPPPAAPPPLEPPKPKLEVKVDHQAITPPKNVQPMESFLLNAKDRAKYRQLLLNHVPLKPVPVAAVAARRNMSVEAFLQFIEDHIPPEFIIVDKISPQEQYVSLPPLYKELLSIPPDAAEDYYSLAADPVKGDDLGDEIDPSRQRPHCPCIAEDYDAYRLARFLSVTEFKPIEQLKVETDGILTRPLHQVMLSFPNLFAFETQEMKSVKFTLRSELIPPEVNEMDCNTMKEEIKHYQELKKSFKPSENAQRVQAIKRFRYLQRCLAMQTSPVPEIDPDVLAYHLFDVLPNEPIQTGLLPTLLPEAVSEVTDTRSRKFLGNYPHLFFIFEHPPLFYLQRADLPRPEQLAKEGMTKDELAMSVAAIIAERKAGKKKGRARKEVLTSHISKFLPEISRKQIKTEFGTIEKLLEEFEGKYFVLIRDQHATEFVLDLVDEKPAPPESRLD